MGNSEPIVSVVIPTLNRPHLVVRAVQSALAQTLNAIEVVIVVEGPDEVTVQFLSWHKSARRCWEWLVTRVHLVGAGEWVF